MLKILLQEMNILNMLGWDFSVSPKSLSTEFADYPDEIEEKRFHGASVDCMNKIDRVKIGIRKPYQG